jgi:hypothetical protein
MVQINHLPILPFQDQIRNKASARKSAAESGRKRTMISPPMSSIPTGSNHFQGWVEWGDEGPRAADARRPCPGLRYGTLFRVLRWRGGAVAKTDLRFLCSHGVNEIHGSQKPIVERFWRGCVRSASRSACSGPGARISLRPRPIRRCYQGTNDAAWGNSGHNRRFLGNHNEKSSFVGFCGWSGGHSRAPLAAVAFALVATEGCARARLRRISGRDRHQQLAHSLGTNAG